MATVQDLVDRSLRLIGQLPSGESATSDETADAMEAFNGLLALWRNEDLMCWSMRTETVPMVATQSSYTVGPTGDLVSTRPVSIESAYMLVGTASHPVSILTEEQYASLRSKSETAEYPTAILFRPTMPDATILVHPVPTDTDSLKITTRVPISAFAAKTDTVSLPPGWEEAIVTNGAVVLAPEFETEAKPSVVQRAIVSKASLKRTNKRSSVLNTELVELLGGGTSNILTGD